MSEVRGRLVKREIRGRIFGGVGAEQLAALFGRNAVVFLDALEDSTAALIDFAPSPGSVLPNNTGNDTLFIGRMPFAKPPEAGVTVRVAGIGAEFMQLRTLADAQIPDGAYGTGDYVLFVRPGEAGWAALTFFSGDLGGATGGGALVVLSPTEASTQTHLVLAPAPGSSVAGTGQNAVFFARMPYDRPAEAGVIMTVVGVNDAEPFQFQTLGGDQIPPDAYSADDFALFVRPEGTHFRALDFYRAEGGGSGGEADPVGEQLGQRAAARAEKIAEETRGEVDALTGALGFDGALVTKTPFAGGDLIEGGGGLQFGGAQLLTWPTAYAADDLTLDFVNGYYANGGERTRTLRALPGFSYTRTGNKGEYDGTRVLFQNASVPAILSGLGFYARQSITNLLTGSAFLTTQNVTTAAADYTLSFIGTGTVTLSGSYAGVLVGTGANNRVSLTFTAAAGTLTVTVAGSVRMASVILGTLRGPIIITPVGASATVGADTLQVSYSLDDEPFLMMVKVDLKLAGFTTRLLCLNEANSGNNIRFERLATNQLRATPTVAGAAVAVGQIAANTTSTTGVVVLAIRRDAAGRFSEAARHVNGACVVAAPGAAAAMPPGMVRLDIGNFFGADQPRSPIQAVRCLRGDFADAQVLALLAAA
jgi:hypothetical protein